MVFCVPSSAIIIGDVNEDGGTNIVDGLAIAQSSAGTKILSQTQLSAADVNGDGKVTLIDAKFITQAAVGLRIL